MWSQTRRRLPQHHSHQIHGEVQIPSFVVWMIPNFVVWVHLALLQRFFA
jgi:hypothetical protein